MDNQFRLIDNAEIYLQDLNTLYTTKFQTEALGLTDEYGIKYLMLTPSTKELYDIKDFEYTTKDCFELVYKNETKIYKIKCELKEN